MSEQTPAKVMEVRGKFYELLSHCIPPTVILKVRCLLGIPWLPILKHLIFLFVDGRRETRGSDGRVIKSRCDALGSLLRAQNASREQENLPSGSVGGKSDEPVQGNALSLLGPNPFMGLSLRGWWGDHLHQWALD